MGDFDQFTVEDLHEIVNADKLGQMKSQAEGWQAMSNMFQAQLDRLEKASASLKQVWSSPAADRFQEEVGKIKKTLEAAQQKAASNHQAWTSIAAEGEKTKTKITTIYQEYQQAWGKAQTDYQTAKKKDADNINWAWGGLSDLWDDPNPPDQNAVRAPYDAKARTAMAAADTVYTEEYVRNLWWPPEYQGPKDARTPYQPSGTYRSPSGYNTGGNMPTYTYPSSGNVPSGNQPPHHTGHVPDIITDQTHLPPDDGVLQTIPTLPPPTIPLPTPTPVPTPTPLPPGPGVPLPLPDLPGGRLPTKFPVPGGEFPPRTTPPRLPRPPLMPEIPETSPVIGRTTPGGRSPGMPSNEPVVGRRTPGGSLPEEGGLRPGRTSMPGGRGRGVPGEAELPTGRTAGRGRTGPSVSEEVIGERNPNGRGTGRGRAPGAGRELPGERGTPTRRGTGRGLSGESVEAGRSGTARRGAGRGLAGELAESERGAGKRGASGRGAAERAVTSGRDGGRAGGWRSSRRRDEDAEQYTDLLDEGLFAVADAVPDVIEPSAPTAPQQAGPSLGGGERKQR